MYWLGYLPGSVFRERVSGASSFVCTGCSTYLEACFGSVFQEQAPSCVPALKLVRMAKVARVARVANMATVARGGKSGQGGEGGEDGDSSKGWQSGQGVKGG